MAHLRINWHSSVLIDDEDYERCKPFRWHITDQKKYRGTQLVRKKYVFTRLKVNGKYKPLILARFILNVPPEFRVTYVNSNHMDCRKANLKVNGIRQDLPRIAGFSHEEILAAVTEDSDG